MRPIWNFLVFVSFSCGVACGENNRVELTISENITWKDFFDGGFRPHHVMDGKNFCREFDLQLTLFSTESDLELEMNPGSAFFSIAKDNLVVGFRYDTTTNLSLAEAQEKIDQFHRMFSNQIDPEHRGVLVYDENTNRYDYDKSNAGARFGEWRILYSLTPSYQEVQYPQPPRSEWRPFIERLSIVYRGDTRKMVARWDKPIEPPPGYEHVSLQAPARAISADSQKSAIRNGARNRQPADESTGDHHATNLSGDSTWGLFFAACLSVGILIVVIRARRRRS